MKEKLPPSTAAALLGKIAALDNRTVTKENAIEFAKALIPMTFQDAQAAVEAHRATSSEWLMPSHLNNIVKQWRTDRVRVAPLPFAPEVLADQPLKEIEWKKAWVEAIANGYSVSEADAMADSELGCEPRLLCEASDAFTHKALERGERLPEHLSRRLTTTKRP